MAHRRNLGLTGRTKLMLQVLVECRGVVLILFQAHGDYSTHLMVPFFKKFRPDLMITRPAAHPYLWPIAFLPFRDFVVLVIGYRRMP